MSNDVQLTNMKQIDDLPENTHEPSKPYINDSYVESIESLDKVDDDDVRQRNGGDVVKDVEKQNAYDSVDDVDNDDSKDYNMCSRQVLTIQSAVVSLYINNEKWIWRIFYILLAILFVIYFAFAMNYHFGDEGSYRLLGYTVLGVFLLFMHFAGPYIYPAISRCTKVFEGKNSARNARIIKWLLYIIASVCIVTTLIIYVVLETPNNLVSLAGLAGFLLITYITSVNPAKVNWHPIFWGLALQYFFALIILRTQPGYELFDWLGDRVTEFLEYTDAGSEFVFGPNFKDHFFAFKVMPVVTFFSTFIAITYYLGVMQAIVRVFGRFLSFCLGTTPAESLNAAGNIFVGMTEAPLMIKPFLPIMTLSELHAVMTGGFATIAGSVFGAYLSYGVPGNHLLSASVMSAPAALAISKLTYPETQKTKSSDDDYNKMVKGKERNVIEAASAGASLSIQLIANIVVNLIAFLALLEFVNACLTWAGNRVGWEGITFQFICSYLLYPVALFMGTEFADCRQVAKLIGIKTFTNEFIAYEALSVYINNKVNYTKYISAFPNMTDSDLWETRGDDMFLIQTNETLVGGIMSERSEIISTYSLCGFSNIGSMGILLGGLSALAPERRSDLSSIVLRAMIAGNIACFLTACIAGLFFQPMA
ncbi:hypothetical protein SNE40_022840 [Patella caerulea]|uniref:Sodium/nucleoside cotransporter n=1 Tax=Patella caerulea TaxID=87958 RepID=A0AAN8GG06_PATCE